MFDLLPVRDPDDHGNVVEQRRSVALMLLMNLIMMKYVSYGIEYVQETRFRLRKSELIRLRHNNDFAR